MVARPHLRNKDHHLHYCGGGSVCALGCDVSNQGGVRLQAKTCGDTKMCFKQPIGGYTVLYFFLCVLFAIFIVGISATMTIETYRNKVRVDSYLKCVKELTSSNKETLCLEITKLGPARQP